MLLSRVAEELYWAGRYLERAEDTARLVREYTNLMVDLPTIVPVTWSPLLLVSGHPGGGAPTDERGIVDFLVADPKNPSSVVSSIHQARENLRNAREVIPHEFWQVINDLHLYAAGNASEGVARASRQRFLERVVHECQRAAGVVHGTMSRSAPYRMLRLGHAVERADMTTRVLEVAVVVFGSDEDSVAHGNVLWASVLSSVAALQMFRRSTRVTPNSVDVIEFLLDDAMFPRSVAACMEEVRSCAIGDSDQLIAAVDRVDRQVALVPHDSDEAARRSGIDAIQQAVALVHERVAHTYFAPSLAGRP
jgi:uncharacterized alpha-E superfamily protein